MSDLIVITYDDQATGRQAFDALDEMQKMQLITLEDEDVKDAAGENLEIE